MGLFGIGTRRLVMDEDRARFRVYVILLTVVVIIIVAALLSRCRKANAAELKAAFGCSLEVCYDGGRVGAVVATSGKVVGAGLDKTKKVYPCDTSFIDLTDPNDPQGRGVRCYTPKKFAVKKNSVYLVTGTITSLGQLEVPTAPRLVPALARVVPKCP
jgi:hypothetical protein